MGYDYENPLSFEEVQKIKRQHRIRKKEISNPGKRYDVYIWGELVGTNITFAIANQKLKQKWGATMNHPKVKKIIHVN